MDTVDEVLAQLRAKGSEQTRSTYIRHGMAPDRTLGVSVADMKTIAKAIKGKQDLTSRIYETHIMEAMYLAGLVANGAKMTRAELDAWADGAEEMQLVSEHTVPWVASESPFGRELAVEWINSPKEHVAAAGWRTYAGLVTTLPDSSLDLPEIEGLLANIPSQIGKAQNRVQHAMNSFIVAVGAYVRPLCAQAKATAQQIDSVVFDVGNTACKVPAASAAIAKVEAAGKAGIKKKTIRC